MIRSEREFHHMRKSYKKMTEKLDSEGKNMGWFLCYRQTLRKFVERKRTNQNIIV